MFIATPSKRTNLTVEDRRAVFIAARSRKPYEVVDVPHDKFVRNMLKERMGWPSRDPAPEFIVVAAKEITASLAAVAVLAAAKVAPETAAA